MHMMRHIRSIPRTLNPDLPKKLTQRAGHIPTTAKFIRRIQRDHYPALQELFAEVHLWIVLLVFRLGYHLLFKTMASTSNQITKNQKTQIKNHPHMLCTA